MQVMNNNYVQGNRTNQTFTGIKKVSCEGLYKKYPEFGKELVDTFKKNPKAMEFCNKYDVKVVFYAIKQGIDSVQASVNIFYDNIAKSKLKKLFFGTSDDKVVIHGWGNEYDLKNSLAAATNNLKSAISPYREGLNKPSGLLDSHMENADKGIQEVLDKKAKAAQEKLEKLEAKRQSKNELKNSQTELEESIKDLIDKNS